MGEIWSFLITNLIIRRYKAHSRPGISPNQLASTSSAIRNNEEIFRRFMLKHAADARIADATFRDIQTWAAAHERSRHAFRRECLWWYLFRYAASGSEPWQTTMPSRRYRRQDGRKVVMPSLLPADWQSWSRLPSSATHHISDIYILTSVKASSN